MSDGLSYRTAGVDLDRSGAAKGALAALVESTRTPGTLSGLGAFGGLFRVPREFERPVLVSSTDGVGTKLKVAFLVGRHDSVGQDLVNHCVNDILVHGARPLFFLDYLGMGELEPGVVEQVVAGVAAACRENGCALLGGETAEMPGFYEPGEYDLAGTVVGVVEEELILDGAGIQPGDAVVALASSGLHSNGYSLARKVVFERLGLSPEDPFPDSGETVAETLLRVHRSYLRALEGPLSDGCLRGLAHVTGGGLEANLPRVLPPGLSVRVDLRSWDPPPLFRTLQQAGGIETGEMFRVFNMGVGMVAFVGPGRTDARVAGLRAAGEEAWVAGEVVEGDGRVMLT